MQFIQPNSLIKSTLFNVLQKSACMQSSATVGRTCYGLQAYSCMALKVAGGSVCTFGTPTTRTWGGQDPRTPQDRRHYGKDVWTNE